VFSLFQAIKKITPQDRLEQYVDAYLKIHDVQTEYLSKAKKEEWDNRINRLMVGIGIQLEIVNELPKIKEVVIGGPAWKTNQLSAESVILKVAEEEADFVDLIGLTMSEILELIKGKQGSKVRLSIKKPNGNIEEITITRDKIELELAKSFLLKDKNSAYDIGYIRLPRFYAGEEGCAVHVHNQIKALKAKKTDGIIFDLRNNKGGYARGAIDIMSYFLEGGPVMQTKHKDGNHRIIEDEDGSILWDGPLIVLVNSNSGSASELLSGTMQDFKRGIIVGSPATFGKGTMQRFLDVIIEENETTKSIGEIKMTVGAFYPASGRSTQYFGIQPDIVLPDDFLYIKSGERAYKHTLKTENLPFTETIQKVNQFENLDKIKNLSNQRVQNNKQFKMAMTKAKTLKENQEKTKMPLAFNSFKDYQKQQQIQQNQYQEIFQPIDNFQVDFIAQSSTQLENDAISNKKEKWINRIQQDPYIYECFWIMNDMI